MYLRTNICARDLSKDNIAQVTAFREKTSPTAQVVTMITQPKVKLEKMERTKLTYIIVILDNKPLFVYILTKLLNL